MTSEDNQEFEAKSTERLILLCGHEDDTSPILEQLLETGFPPHWPRVRDPTPQTLENLEADTQAGLQLEFPEVWVLQAPFAPEFEELVVSHRHLGLAVIIVSPQLRVSPTVRLNANEVIWCPPAEGLTEHQRREQRQVFWEQYALFLEHRVDLGDPHQYTFIHVDRDTEQLWRGPRRHQDSNTRGLLPDLLD